MKITRIITALTLAVALTTMQVACTVQAHAEYAHETQAMEKAILSVKEKIEIPVELTEFASEYSTYVGKDMYRFRWSEEDGEKSIVISCDPKGRIRSYYCYGYGGSDVYVGVTLEEARLCAEGFLKKIAPEAFADVNDTYVFEDYCCNYYTSQVSCIFTFSRYRNGSKVAYNDASIEVNINGNEMTVRGAVIGYDYNAVFEDMAEEIADAESAYKKAFPLEMVYTDYTKRKSDGEYEDDVYLVYRIEESGYISAYTGEVVEEPADEAVPTYNKVENVAPGGGGAQLTDAEIAELNKIGSLVSEQDSLKYLKSIPHLAVRGMDVAAQISGLRATDEERNEYSRYFEFDETLGDGYIYATVDAVRGRLLYYTDDKAYRPLASDAPMSESEKTECNAKTDEFISFVAGDIIGEFELEEKRENDTESERRYRRTVNGVRYLQDSIYVNYDADSGTIANYSLTYNNNAEFADPSEAVNEETAYSNLLAEEPLEKAYVKLGDKYKLVYYLVDNPLIDAFTGEKLTSGTQTYNPQEMEYTDVDNHWSRDKVNFLRDLGVAFEGTELNPDTPIAQSDILRIFAAGTNGGWYMTTEIEDLYDRAYDYDAMEKEERSESAAVTREQAFKYMVCFMKYGTVAKLPDIYKVKYADGDMLSDGMVGYAAILSGMGIINGDGSVIRPKDYITRAEALTMVYNYMTSPLR